MIALCRLPSQKDVIGARGGMPVVVVVGCGARCQWFLAGARGGGHSQQECQWPANIVPRCGVRVKRRRAIVLPSVVCRRTKSRCRRLRWSRSVSRGQMHSAKTAKQCKAGWLATLCSDCTPLPVWPCCVRVGAI
jgi:hypothetical protein